MSSNFTFYVELNVYTTVIKPLNLKSVIEYLI